MSKDQERAQAMVLRALLELSTDWLVNLSNVGGEWTLIITGVRTQKQHTYVGGDLMRVINHAWAGAPDGRV